MIRFKDITQFTVANYATDVPIEMVARAIDRWAESQTVEMDPDFQREHVWDDLKRTRYMEFLLRGGRSGRDIYWNCADWQRGFTQPIVLVDGKQRLTAIMGFFDNTVPVFGGHYYRDFEDQIGMSPSIRFHVNDLRTRRAVLQWYIDLNDGGVAHTPEEIARVRALVDADANTARKAC